MVAPSPLDDPDNSRFAWARYRRIVARMALFALIATGLILGGLYLLHGALSVHFYIAVGLGVFLTIMLACALMGLAFLSSGTGHDESVIDPTKGHGKRKY